MVASTSHHESTEPIDCRNDAGAPHLMRLKRSNRIDAPLPSHFGDTALPPRLSLVDSELRVLLAHCRSCRAPKAAAAAVAEPAQHRLLGCPVKCSLRRGVFALAHLRPGILAVTAKVTLSKPDDPLDKRNGQVAHSASRSVRAEQESELGSGTKVHRRMVEAATPNMC